MRVAGLALVFVASLVCTLWLAAVAFGAAQERQTTYRYFAQALDASVERGHSVDWRAPDAALARPFTDGDAALLGRALDEAWQVLALAQETGDGSILADRFSGVALERAALSVADATAHGGRMAVLSQKAQPVFFHKDGSLFQAETETVVARYLGAETGLSAFELTRETGIATLLNESSGWRLYSYERRASIALPDGAAPWTGAMRGFNYYPAGSPWRAFWREFDPAVTEADFAAVRALGGDSVRVFLTREDFLADAPDAALARLEQLLALAQQQGLRVVPTLFDLKPHYRLGGWAEDARYLQRVLPVLAASGAVAFVDIKNEPDLDFAAHGTAKVTAWLNTMAGLIRDAAPGLPLTVGWSDAAQAGRLAKTLDVISYHEYAPIAGTGQRLATVRALAGGKPVVVSEIGQSSFDLGFGYPGSEARQAASLAQRLDALAGAEGVLVWTLHDFPVVDATVIGASPWRQRLQAAFGVLRADGTEKPAVAALRERWPDLSERVGD